VQKNYEKMRCDEINNLHSDFFLKKMNIIMKLSNVKVDKQVNNKIYYFEWN
jgi:hypothetical protein